MRRERITLQQVLRFAGPFPVHRPLFEREGADERPFELAEVAARFRDLRRQSPIHMTQARLAGLLGICRQSVNEIENAHVRLHLSTWGKFRDLERRYRQAAEVQLPENWD